MGLSQFTESHCINSTPRWVFNTVFNTTTESPQIPISPTTEKSDVSEEKFSGSIISHIKPLFLRYNDLPKLEGLCSGALLPIWHVLPLYHYTYANPPHCRSSSPYQAWERRLFGFVVFFSYSGSLCVDCCHEDLQCWVHFYLLLFPSGRPLHPSRRSLPPQALMTRNDAYSILNCISRKYVG